MSTSYTERASKREKGCIKIPQNSSLSIQQENVNKSFHRHGIYNTSASPALNVEIYFTTYLLLNFAVSLCV